MRLAEFGFPGDLRDRLVAAILSGEKTSTSSLYAEYEEEGEPLPEAGERQLVVDSKGRGVAVIELTCVEIKRMDDIDLPFAIDEGEGFESVDEWREAHERFWRSYRDDDLGDETLVVAERFRVVERL